MGFETEMEGLGFVSLLYHGKFAVMRRKKRNRENRAGLWLRGRCESKD